MQDLRYDRAVADVIEVIMFDQWMRHYFTTERDGKLFLEIPEDVLDEVRREHPALFTLAEPVNNAELTYKKCQDNICTYMASSLDGSKYADGVVATVFDSKPFKIEQYVFSLWLKGHEAYLDAERRSFSEWKEMYENWKKMDEVREYIFKLQAGTAGQEQTSSTVH